jgi:hypothetical protein
MRWFLLWLGLVLAASAVTGYLCLRLYRQTKSLGAEGAAASARLSDAAAGISRETPATSPDRSNRSIPR